MNWLLRIFLSFAFFSTSLWASNNNVPIRVDPFADLPGVGRLNVLNERAAAWARAIQVLGNWEPISGEPLSEAERLENPLKKEVANPVTEAVYADVPDVAEMDAMGDCPAHGDAGNGPMQEQQNQVSQSSQPQSTAHHAVQQAPQQSWREWLLDAAPWVFFTGITVGAAYLFFRGDAGIVVAGAAAGMGATARIATTLGGRTLDGVRAWVVESDNIFRLFLANGGRVTSYQISKAMYKDLVSKFFRRAHDRDVHTYLLQILEDGVKLTLRQFWDGTKNIRFQRSVVVQFL